MLRKSLLLMLFMALAPLTVFAQGSRPVRQITDADIVGNTTWSKDTVYVLNGFVFVEDGEVLNIQAGTVIKGKPGQGVNASALIVARGGRIYARGSSSQPIIFTAESDDVDNPNDLPSDSRGLWGGLILLGKARINTAKGTGNIEGIPDTEPRGAYGGSNDHDNSGVYQYLSLRYGGTDIGAGNEINGLTFGAVGDSTVVDHIEVFNNADDGYEWFGGTVNTKYLVSAFNGDDSFDTDEGFNGKSQFWFAIQSDQNGIGNRGGEHDGGTVPEDGLPLSIPVHYNCTYIGAGVGTANVENDLTFIFRDNAGGRYMNSVFTDFNNEAIDVEDLTSGEDSRHRLELGDLTLTNNLFYGYGAGSTWDKLVHNGTTTNAYVVTYLSDAANHNSISDPMLHGISRTSNGMLDPRPKSGSPALTAGATVPSDGFYTQVSYKGAFGPDAGDNWLRGWTFLDQAGYLATPVESGKPVKVVADKDITRNTTFYADTIYALNGFVFVEDGEVLTIQPGTVIKGKPGQGVNASALIVARGGKIYAQGTAVKPIIFTAESDNVDEVDDLPLDARGLWGGVILLGKARINTAKGTGNIEGIPDTEPRGAYGGTDDHDNSGIMQYCSLRYGGTDIGAGNEINGLTFGAVGDGTTIDHIEVFNNADDGYEWFGGTVNTKYLISAFNGDDSFDTDEGFNGKSQFWFAIQSDQNGIGNRGGEHDGGTVPEDGLPLSIPVHYNSTYIGAGVGTANVENDLTFIFRDNAGGRYMNSVFTDFNNKAIDVEDLTSGEDSRHRLEVGDLTLTNNLFYGYGAGSTWTDLVLNGATTSAYVVTYMSDAANHNDIVNPKLRGISRTNDGKLDPRVEFGSPALSVGAAVPSDGFYTQVTYKGAFNATDDWALGWTFLDKAGFLSHTVYQDTTHQDTTGKKNCDFNLDSKNDVSDVIFMLLLSRSNPTDSRLDWNHDGHYMINDAVDLLLDIRNGNCSGSTVLLASVDGGMIAGASAVSAPRLSEDEVRFLETQIQVMGLTEEQEAEFHVAMYGAGAPASLPKAFSLAQNSPNPFNPSTTISFAVPEGSNGKVSLKVYDLRGSTVRTLIDEVRTPGAYQVFWDGNDNRGQAVASGVYFYRMQAGDFVMTRKMVLLR
ncbi:T9SS type A sorting domain-containing protein [bacterium]|nr:T9SS type A sorting domain-containing protein [bacterium]